jgi:hypothetical protein
MGRAYQVRSRRQTDQIPNGAAHQIFCLISQMQHKCAGTNGNFWSESTPCNPPKEGSAKTFEQGKIMSKIVPGNAVKPFGNSQKGIGNGPLTWLTASDKYARHR